MQAKPQVLQGGTLIDGTGRDAINEETVKLPEPMAEKLKVLLRE